MKFIPIVNNYAQKHNDKVVFLSFYDIFTKYFSVSPEKRGRPRNSRTGASAGLSGSPSH